MRTALSVKVRKTVRIQATQKTDRGKVTAKHLPLRFESSNARIAAVTKDGVVKGKMAGYHKYIESNAEITFFLA